MPKKIQKIVTKTDFSKMCHVTPGAITKVCKGAIKKAIVRGRIDSNHKDAKKYLKQKLKEYEEKPVNPLPDEVNPGSTIEVPKDIQVFLNFTLREVYEKFGTTVVLKDFLDAVRQIALINEKNLKNAQTEGTLVSRAAVQIVLDVIEACHIRLVTDGAETITRSAIEMTKAGKTKKEIKAMVVDIMASNIKNVKPRTKKALKNA